MPKYRIYVLVIVYLWKACEIEAPPNLRDPTRVKTPQPLKRYLGGTGASRCNTHLREA